MIRFAYLADDDSTTILGFGLEEGNLSRLLEEKPIVVNGGSMGVAGSDFILVAGATDEAALEEGKKAADTLMATMRLPEDHRVPCVDIEKATARVLLIAHDHGTFYVIVLGATSYAHLKAEKSITFRCRQVAGERNTPDVEVRIFHSTDDVISKLQAEGVLPPRT